MFLFTIFGLDVSEGGEYYVPFMLISMVIFIILIVLYLKHFLWMIVWKDNQIYKIKSKKYTKTQFRNQIRTKLLFLNLVDIILCCVLCYGFYVYIFSEMDFSGIHGFWDVISFMLNNLVESIFMLFFTFNIGYVLYKFFIEIVIGYYGYRHYCNNCSHGGYNIYVSDGVAFSKEKIGESIEGGNIYSDGSFSLPYKKEYYIEYKHEYFFCKNCGFPIERKRTTKD